MKKSKQAQKLRLALDTVKILTSRDLQRVIGGYEDTGDNPSTSSCALRFELCIDRR